MADGGAGGGAAGASAEAGPVRPSAKGYELARLLSKGNQRIVVIVDKSMEIAGTGVVPHDAIGNARVLTVVQMKYFAMSEDKLIGNLQRVIKFDDAGGHWPRDPIRQIFIDMNWNAVWDAAKNRQKTFFSSS